MGESKWVTVGMKEGTGLRFSRGGRSDLGLFITRPLDGRNDIRSDPSTTLYIEVSDSTEVVLEWVAKSDKRSLSSVF